MKISNYNQNWFSFQFDEEIIDDNEKAVVNAIKSDIDKKGRRWMHEQRLWLIHQDYFDEFMYIITEYYRTIVFQQQELF